LGEFPARKAMKHMRPWGAFCGELGHRSPRLGLRVSVYGSLAAGG